MIKERLKGKRIAITGSTGFLGTALVELMLREIEDVKLILLVRSSQRSADRRVKRDILNNDAFDILKESIGNEKFNQLIENQIVPVPADIAEEGLGLDDDGLEALKSCDVVIHLSLIHI